MKIAIFLLLGLALTNSVLAQPYSFESRATLKNINYTDSTIVIRIIIPNDELTMIRKGMGKANANEALTVIGQNAALDVKKLVERFWQKQRDDARDFIPQSEIDKALDARKVWEDKQGGGQ